MGASIGTVQSPQFLVDFPKNSVYLIQSLRDEYACHITAIIDITGQHIVIAVIGKVSQLSGGGPHYRLFGRLIITYYLVKRIIIAIAKTIPLGNLYLLTWQNRVRHQNKSFMREGCPSRDESIVVDPNP